MLSLYVNSYLLVTRVAPKATPQQSLLARHWLDPGIQWRIVGSQNFFSTSIENQRYWKTVERCLAQRYTCKQEVPVWEKENIVLLNRSSIFFSS